MLINFVSGFYTIKEALKFNVFYAIKEASKMNRTKFKQAQCL